MIFEAPFLWLFAIVDGREVFLPHAKTNESVALLLWIDLHRFSGIESLSFGGMDRV